MFEYITERVDSVTLAPKVIEKLRANIDNAEYPLLYSFSNYIIENQIEEGYSLVLCFALSGYSLSANVMETLVKKGMKIEEIKKKIRDLKLKQKMTTGRLEWNDIQREIDILNNELKQLETDKPQYGK